MKKDNTAFLIWVYKKKAAKTGLALYVGWLKVALVKIDHQHVINIKYQMGRVMAHFANIATRAFFILLLSAGLWGGPIQSIARANESCEGVYFDPLTINPTLLPPPPALGSAAEKQDLQAVLKAQKSIAPDDLENLKQEQHYTLDLVTQILGPDFSRDKFPVLYALLDHAQVDAGCVNKTSKQYWNRQRPYVADKHVRLLVQSLPNAAYPSGHTSGSRVIAEILGMLLPQKQALLRERAEEIAKHRVEAGVHYPTDLVAGRIEASLILGALFSAESFQRDLEAARRELGGAH